MTQQEILTG